MSPELFEPERFDLKESRPTKYSDCYALGMVIYEVLSGKAPFSRYLGYVVVPRVLKGERPGRPRGTEGIWFTDGIWSTLERCWKPIPGDRPRIREVLQCLDNASGSWTSLFQTVADPPATDSLAWSTDSSAEESTDEDETSSLSQVVSSQLSQKLSTGDKNENNT